MYFDGFCRKDAKKGKAIDQILKDLIKEMDPEKSFLEISEEKEIDLQEIYNIAFHLKYWKVADMISYLDSYTYFS